MTVEKRDNTTKQCRVCRTEKPIEEFYYRKDTGTYRNECKSCLKDIHRFRNIGATSKDYEEMYARQHGKCAICGCVLNSSRYTRFAVDHCHVTGKLRGLLCVNCNTGLGLFKDSIERLTKAIQYLREHRVEDIV